MNFLKLILNNAISFCIVILIFLKIDLCLMFYMGCDVYIILFYWDDEYELNVIKMYLHVVSINFLF